MRNILYYPVPLKRSFNPIFDIISVFKIASIIRKEKPGLVHVHSAKGGFIGRLAGRIAKCKIIYTPHAFSYLSFTGSKRMIFYLLEYISRGWSDLLLPVSYSEANRAYYEIGYPKEKVEVFLNSISVSKENRREDYNSNVQIGMIGRLTYQKDPLLFLQIALELTRRYPSLQFSILGAGLHDHLRRDVESFIINNKLTEKVQILQWGDSTTSINFLKNLDIYITTSAFEGLPFSLIEAMGHGIPCVATVADGNSDVIENTINGYTCLGVNDMINRVESLIKSQELRKEIGQNGWLHVYTKHNIEKNCNQLESIYSRMIIDPANS